MTAAPAEPPAPPSADVALRVVVRNAHRENAALPVAVPDENGLFAPALRPEVFPVVVDANALRDDLLRVAAGRPRTLMLNGANSGVLRLFCAAHAVEEVDEHLEEWSAQRRHRSRGLDGGRAERVRSTRNTFDAYGMTVGVDDAGDTGVTGDVTCTKTTYEPRNTSAWILSGAHRSLVLAVPCASAGNLAALTDADVVSDTRAYFDNATTWARHPPGAW
jgi:hypothetical protein